MLKIGDFSALSQVSVKTLRYYDERGLLQPAYIDAATGYRYYSAAQLSQLHRILALKDFGFSLEQIAESLQPPVTAEQMRGMLRLREAEQQARVEDEVDRLSRLRSRIRLIEQETRMPQDVVLKDVPAQWVASLRETIANYPAVGALYPRVAAALGPAMANSTMAFAIWHAPEYQKTDVDAEAGFCLQKAVQAANGIQVHQLPAATMASIVHNGSYQRLPEAYDALLRWVASNGYELAGPIREFYVQMSQPVRQDDESYVTEVQVPVSKAA